MFLYQLELKDIFPRKNPLDGGITFYDKKTEDIVGNIPAPYMNDASGEAYSEEQEYSIGQKEGEEDIYILGLTVSEEYLHSSERVYPVTIDPTITWTGSTDIADVYVLNNASYRTTNFYSSGVNTCSVGDGAQGLYRTYFRFSNYLTKLVGYYVDSAKFTVYETGNGESGTTVQAHRVTEDRVFKFIKTVLLVICILEFIPLFIYATKKDTSNSVGYAQKTYEFTSMNGLKHIFVDSFDNVYCYYSVTNTIAVYDTNLEMRYVYNLPYSSNGMSELALIEDSLYICNKTNTIYQYLDGEFIEKTEVDEQNWGSLYNKIEQCLTEAEEARDSMGNIYRINIFYPTIYKNEDVVLQCSLVQWIFMAMFPSVLIFGIAYITLVLIDIYEKRLET